MIRVFKSHTVALYSLHHLFDGLVLCHNRVFELGSHTLESDFFLSTEFLHRYSCHHRHHLFDVSLADDGLFGVITLSPFLVHLLEFSLQIGLHIAESSSQFVVLVFHRTLFLTLHLLQFILLVGDFLWHIAIADTDVSSCLVHGVDSLVGELSVGDIPGGEVDACQEGIIGIFYVMMLLVSLAQVIENLYCLFLCSGFYHHLLESALQCSVLLDAIAELVEGGGTNTLYCSAGKGRFHDVCGIHCSRCTSCTHQGVYLVNKYNNVGIVFQFLEQSL